MILAIAGIGTAVVLYPILKRQNEGVVLGYVGTRVVECTIIVVGIISVLSIVTLRQDLAGAAGANAASLETVGTSLVAVKDWTFLFGLYEQVSVWASIAIIPEFLWELSLGIWLIVKGFNPSAIARLEDESQ